MTSGRQTVVDWSVVMSPSSPWTVTRGRAAATAIFWVERSVTVRLGYEGKMRLGLQWSYIANGVDV